MAPSGVVPRTLQPPVQSIIPLIGLPAFTEPLDSPYIAFPLQS